MLLKLVLLPRPGTFAFHTLAGSRTGGSTGYESHHQMGIKRFNW